MDGTVDNISTFWGPILAFIALIVWSIRLEGKVVSNEKSIKDVDEKHEGKNSEHKEVFAKLAKSIDDSASAASDENKHLEERISRLIQGLKSDVERNNQGVWQKMDQVQIQLKDVQVLLARLEGRLYPNEKTDNRA